MDQATPNKIVSFIWGIADDILRDVFVWGKYRDVIPAIELHQLPLSCRRGEARVPSAGHLVEAII